MKKNDASQRATELVNEAIEVLLRADRAPDSPVSSFVPAERRREFRRGAARLRAGKARPLYENLHTAEELAEIQERTVKRDEILEQAVREFTKITFALGDLLQEYPDEVGAAMDALIAEVKRAAEEQGPGSEAAQRFRQLQFLGWFGNTTHARQRSRKRRRRQGPAEPEIVASISAVEARHVLCAVEQLSSPPAPGETVIAIPPVEQERGRPRVWLRVGLGELSWIGCFEIGEECVSTASMMPDGRHLFISVQGAGYIIDTASRTLVAMTGTRITGTMSDEARTLFIVNHNDTTFEAFDRAGRLWKTRCISMGEFRDLALTNDALVGQSRPPGRRGWVGFSVDLWTGKVWFAE